jgi:hypothetical protein
MKSRENMHVMHDKEAGDFRCAACIQITMICKSEVSECWNKDDVYLQQSKKGEIRGIKMSL